MKTITLTQEAYDRLASLKASPGDSFSRVVLRSVPKRGTAAQMLRDFRTLSPLSSKQDEAMKNAIKEQRDRKNWRDPWGSF